MPNSVWVENEYFKTVYEEAGYRNFKIIKEVPRLEYLEQIKRLRPEKNTVLIACGMHDYELIFRSISKFLKKMLSSFLNFIQEQIIKNLVQVLKISFQILKLGKSISLHILIVFLRYLLLIAQ